MDHKYYSIFIIYDQHIATFISSGYGDLHTMMVLRVACYRTVWILHYSLVARYQNNIILFLLCSWYIWRMVELSFDTCYFIKLLINLLQFKYLVKGVHLQRLFNLTLVYPPRLSFEASMKGSGLVARHTFSTWPHNDLVHNSEFARSCSNLNHICTWYRVVLMKHHPFYISIYCCFRVVLVYRLLLLKF